jgi:hypothetical protein
MELSRAKGAKKSMRESLPVVPGAAALEAKP